MNLLERLNRLLRRATKKGLSEGLLGGSTLWTIVGAAALLVRLARRPRKTVVLTERLEPGEALEVRHLQETRRARRRR